jgi:hypothetical protein
MSAFAGRAFERDPNGRIGEQLADVELAFTSGGRTHEVTTSEGGSYRIELEPGRYTVAATKDGYETTETVTILAGRQQTLNVFLSATPTSEVRTGFRGRAFQRNPDASIGETLEGVSVAFSRPQFTRTVTTAEDGTYSVELPAGSYIVSLRKDGYEPARSRVVVREGVGVFNPFLRAAEPEEEEVPMDICDYAPNRSGQTRTSEVILPGSPDPVELTYQVYDGVAVLEGGIVLGDVDELDEAVREATQEPTDDDIPDSPGVRTARQALVAVRSREMLWDGGVMPYQFDNINVLLRNRIQEAMGHISANTNVEFVPASNAHPDYVVFEFSSDAGASSAELGRKGGKQVIRLNERFDVGGIIHEILHALGVLHEQSRNDRDAFVQINDGSGNTSNNICPGRESQFAKRNATAQDIGPYDYDSVMHYSAFAFTQSGGTTCNPPLRPSIQPRDSSIPVGRLGSARGSAPYLSSGDIAGLDELYPSGLVFDGGHLWGSGNYATDIAFGDIDGDGYDEVVVTRKANTNGRYYMLGSGRNSNAPFPPLFTGGQNWGSGNYATSCATGDIDGDGRDEVVIGRKARTNQRFEVRKFTGGTAQQLFSGGTGWGEGAHTTDVAVGVDSSGMPLIGVTRKAGSNARFFLYGGTGQNFSLLSRGGTNWGSDAYATGIAFGDVDGDGNLEIGVTRKAGTNARFIVYKAINGDYTNLQTLHSGGTDWGSGNYGTGITFGDVDNDGRDEVGVTRFAGENGRFFIFDSADQEFRRLHSGGANWGSGYYATSIAMGDVDGDGRDEVAVARRAESNARAFLLDDAQSNFLPLSDRGASWGSDTWATAVDIGNAENIGFRQRNLAICRKANQNSRFMIQSYDP